ncbi:MAG TPA: hypothetical protein VGR12_03510, partial [Solirubrobacteraceae bacterium]|nr:hypothetical protein [Solirubrobacteraceae bacterium]
MAAQPTQLRAAPGEPVPRVHALEAPPVVPPSRRIRPERGSAPAGELASVLKWTLGVPAVAIVSVVVLYVLGLLWKYGEIQDVGLVPTDVLSLVPHSQILGRGAQLLVLALLALPLPLALTWLLHRILPERGRRGWGLPSALDRVIDEHDRLRRDLDELRGDYDPVSAPGLDKR